MKEDTQSIIKEIKMLAGQLISIPSTADNSQGLRDVLSVARKELRGFHIEEFENNGIQSILVSQQKTKEFKIVLHAHLDVVPASEYKLIEKDGKLYGRGVYDMKVAAAVMIVLFKKLALTLPYPIGLQLVTDEETGGFFGVKHQIGQGVRAEFVISGDTTDLKVNNKAKGILWMKLKTIGKSAHGAYPWQGENALDKLQKVLEKLKVRYPDPQEEIWRTTINIAKIETPNNAFNKVPEEATAFLDIRFIPEENNIILETLTSCIEPDAAIEVLFQEDAEDIEESHSYIQTLKKSIHHITRAEAEMLETHGGSDARLYQKSGIPAVCFGPHGSGQHTEEEWIEISGIQTYYDILKYFLLQVSI